MKNNDVFFKQHFFQFLILFPEPRLMIPGYIVARCDFGKVSHKAFCRFNIRSSGIHQITGKSNNIRFFFFDKFYKRVVFLSELGIMKIGYDNDFKMIKSLRKSAACDCIASDADCYVFPNGPYGKNNYRNAY